MLQLNFKFQLNDVCHLFYVYGNMIAEFGTI